MKKLIALILFAIAMLAIIPFTFADLSTNLMAKYKFESPNQLNDSYGTYEPLFNQSALALVTGVVGQSASFDNLANGVKRFKYNATTDFHINTFTVNAWINPTAFADVNHIVFDNSYYNPSSGFYYGWTFAMRGNGSLQSWIFTGDALTLYCSLIGGKGVTAGKWNMVSMVFDDANNWLAYYVNGTPTYNGSCTYSANFSGNIGWSVGAAIKEGATSASLNGNVDEVAIWNRTLSSAELLSVYNIEKTGVGFETDFSGGTSNSITINAPANQSFSFQFANISITTAQSSTCKYSTSAFDYLTAGTLMTTTNNLTHKLDLNVTDATYTYYYACNSSAGITNSTQHLFYGQSKNWNNEFLFSGDSVVSATPYVTATERFSYLTTQYLASNGYLGLTEDNTAVGGVCCTNVGGCSGTNPMQNRLQADVISHNSRLTFLLPCVNDQIWGVSTADWGTAWNSMFNSIAVNGTNTTLILSSSTLVLYDGVNFLSNAKQADYDSKIREYAILHNKPYAEVHYGMYNNVSLLYDTAHLSVAGHKNVNATLSQAVLSMWTMNTSNYNIYHDCNNTITVLNTTLSMPTANCDDRNANADWLILKNISNSSIQVERADKAFKLNLSGKTASLSYAVTIDNGTKTTTVYTANATGSINNVAMPAGNNYLILLGEQPFSINVASPTNNTRNNQALQVSYNVTKNNSVYSCGLYVDGVLNATNATVQDNVQSSFVISMAGTHIYTWYLNCSDGSNNVFSGVYNYNFDGVTPFIHWTSPSYYNTSVFDLSMPVIINVTDDNLWRVNMSIFSPNGTLLYNNYSGNLNTTNYGINLLFDTTAWLEGNYTILTEGADSHTGERFTEQMYVLPAVEEVSGDISSALVLEKDTPQFTTDSETTLEFVQDTDRISFLLSTETPENPHYFYFKTEEKLEKVDGSEYPCHYVFGHYWFDCEGLTNPVVTEISDNEIRIDYEVQSETARENLIGKDIMQPTPVEELPVDISDRLPVDLIDQQNTLEPVGRIGGGMVVTEVRSLGGLNENNETVQFDIHHCVPDWFCSSWNFSVCLQNDTTPCTQATDSAVCGFPYTGDYSELHVAECDYCVPNLTMTYQSECHSLNDTRWIFYNYSNYGACCAVTNLSDDCNLFGGDYDVHGSWALLVDYNFPCSIFTYNAEDLPNAVIGGGVNFIVAFASFFSVVILLLIIASVYTVFFAGRPPKLLK